MGVEGLTPHLQPDAGSNVSQDKLLPLSPFKEQVEFFRGDLTQNLQRLGGAMLVTVLASTKAALLSAGALTFPLWWPWLKAAKKNNDVKSQYPCARGAQRPTDPHALLPSSAHLEDM